MRLTYRLNLSLTLGVATVSLAVAFYQTRMETRGLERDLDNRSLLLAETLARPAETLLQSNGIPAVQQLIEAFRQQQQLAGIAIYDTAGMLMAATSNLESRINTTPVAVTRAVSDGNARAASIESGRGRMHLAVMPLRENGTIAGALALLHDSGYIESQAVSLWRRAFLGVIIQTAFIVSITLLVVQWGMSRRVRRMADWLRELRQGKTVQAPDVSESDEFVPLTREVTQLASSLTEARAAAQEEARLRDNADSRWTNERLRVFVNQRLDGRRLFVVSNREPYVHVHRSGGIECTVPASGLVTGIEPILLACDGTWIAQATGDADRETADETGRVRVPPEHPQYTLRRVWLSQEEERGFYSGFSNEGLWPLCHIAHTRPVFRAEDWEQYQAVNRKFAEVLLHEIAEEENPVILVQDYHFALLPQLIKRRRPDSRVALFWHIPWPNPEAFGICPWQRQILDGLLGADLIGFHIQAHCNNFLDTVDRAVESRIEWERFAVSRRDHYTLVRPFPISIPIDRNEESGDESPYIERSAILAKLGVQASLVGVGVDRIDYTKGIPERFRGIETFLEKYPAFRGEFTFIQIGSPSRTEIGSYQNLMQEVRREAERINRRFQSSDWKPIVLLDHQHSHEEILPYYRAADLCMVTSLHDGMNLVAKEFVASRADHLGVLILSRFTGASHELTDALVVNPYDTEELADSIHRALQMSPEERRRRMQRMRAIILERNIYRWAGDLIGELCEIRLPRPSSASSALARTAGFL
jgi:alpha,alpha-trehalose-phosphate synthase [UDP-forming]